MDDPVFFTVTQFAEKLNVCPQTVRAWLRNGRVKGIRLNDNEESHWRIPFNELLRLHSEAFGACSNSQNAVK